MTATYLKKKYPHLWRIMYDGMVFDLLECMPQSDVSIFQDKFINRGRISRIAHNAAFMACYEMNKEMNKIKARLK
jgi:hypothetical protein